MRQDILSSWSRAELPVPTLCKLWGSPTVAVSRLLSKKGVQSPWAIAPATGTEQHRWPRTRPLGLQLLPWLQDSLPVPGQAPSRPRAGRQPASLGGSEQCVQEGVANGARELGHSSQGQSQGRRRPWMKSDPGAARQAAPTQLTGRAEPTTKGRQRGALSEGNRARLWPPATADFIIPD